MINININYNFYKSSGYIKVYNQCFEKAIQEQ